MQADELQTCDSPESETSLPLMSSAEGSLAKTSALLAREKESLENGAGYGRICTESLANYDHDSSSWRTAQRCLFGEWGKLLGTWPRSGMTRNGKLFLLVPLVQITYESASGYCPTPTAQGLSRFTSSGGSNARKKWAKMLPTVTAHDYRGGCKPERTAKMRQNSARGLDLPSTLRLLFPNSTGLVRPSWAEARMGFPIGYTECTPSETP